MTILKDFLKMSDEEKKRTGLLEAATPEQRQELIKQVAFEQEKAEAECIAIYQKCDAVQVKIDKAEAELKKLREERYELSAKSSAISDRADRIKMKIEKNLAEQAPTLLKQFTEALEIEMNNSRDSKGYDFPVLHEAYKQAMELYTSDCADMEKSIASILKQIDTRDKHYMRQIENSFAA